MTIVLAALLLVAVAAAVVLLVLLLRARAEVAELREQLAAKRWVPSTRDATSALRAVTRTAVKVRDHGLSGALRSSIDDLAGWAQAERPDLAAVAAADGTVTIVFSDIEDSTALNDRLGDRAFVRLLGRHDRIVRHAVDDGGGHVVKTQGDGFMLAFGSAEDAVAGAVRIQRELRGHLRPPIRVRIGVHTGRAVRRDNDLFGRDVALAARIAACAAGDEILVSDATCAALQRSDAGAVSLGTQRELELKGLPGTHRVHTVNWTQ